MAKPLGTPSWKRLDYRLVQLEKLHPDKAKLIERTRSLARAEIRRTSIIAGKRKHSKAA